MNREKVGHVDASGRGAAGQFRVPYPARMCSYTEEEIEAVVGVMRSAASLSQGEWQAKFESDFRAYAGVEHAFAVSSGTAALRLAATICGLASGDEVIVPAYTFCATAVAIGSTGATLVWADIDPHTRTVCPDDIARKITSRTKAIVAVHLLGMPCDMDRIMQLAADHRLRVIEDCAQAPGALYRGRRVGSIGDIGCFSFNGAKNITTLGEGGMLTLRHGGDAALVPGLRHTGVRPFPANRQRYWVPAMSNVDLDVEGVWPFKFCLTEPQAALGCLLLKRLDRINSTLRRQYDALRERLRRCELLSSAEAPPDREHAAHAFVVSFDEEKAGISRDEFMDVLANRYGIRVIVQYYPLYKYPLFQKMGFAHADCPNLERYWPTSYSYPWWCGMAESDLDYLADSTYSAAKEFSRARVSPGHGLD